MSEYGGGSHPEGYVAPMPNRRQEQAQRAADKLRRRYDPVEWIKVQRRHPFSRGVRAWRPDSRRNR